MLALEMAAFWLSGQWQSSSFHPVVVNAGGGNTKSWNIQCAEGDTLVAFNHGMLAQPDDIRIQPSISIANAAQANWGVTATATQIFLTKQGATGSGGAVPGTTVVAKVMAEVPHSIVQ